MSLIDAFFRFTERSFSYSVGNILAVLVFVMLIILGGIWMFPVIYVMPLSIITLVVMLAVLNHRALMQLVYESHGANAFVKSRYPEAEAYFRKSWELAQTLGPADRCRGQVLEWLTLVMQFQGNYDEAESFGREWLSNDEKVLARIIHQ